MAIEKRNHSNNLNSARRSNVAALATADRLDSRHIVFTGNVCKEMINKFVPSIKISIKITGF